MGRKKLEQGRIVNVTARVSAQQVAAIDAVRGKRSRSVVVAEVLAVAFPVDGSQPPAGQHAAAAPAKIKPAREAKPRTGMCPHRVAAGAYCKRCADA